MKTTLGLIVLCGLAGCGGGNAPLRNPLQGEWRGEWVRAGDLAKGKCSITIDEDGRLEMSAQDKKFRGIVDRDGNVSGECPGWTYIVRGELAFGLTADGQALSGGLRKFGPWPRYH